MSTVFGVIKQEYILGNEKRISYGIAAYADPENAGTACIIHSVPDICDDYEKICNFAELCNKAEMSVLHLDDVINDFLNI